MFWIFCSDSQSNTPILFSLCAIRVAEGHIGQSASIALRDIKFSDILWRSTERCNMVEGLCLKYRKHSEKKLTYCIYTWQIGYQCCTQSEVGHNMRVTLTSQIHPQAQGRDVPRATLPVLVPFWRHHVPTPTIGACTEHCIQSAVRFDPHVVPGRCVWRGGFGDGRSSVVVAPVQPRVQAALLLLDLPCRRLTPRGWLVTVAIQKVLNLVPSTFERNRMCC